MLHLATVHCAGYLSTIGGRRRWFPQITTAAAPLRSHIERQAVNFPVQGACKDRQYYHTYIATDGIIYVVSFLRAYMCHYYSMHTVGSAADICKCGMIRVMQRLADESPNTRYALCPCSQ